MNTLITTLCMKLPKDGVYDYVKCCHKLIESYLKHTPFKILVVTNVPEEFVKYGERVIYKYLPLTDYDEALEVEEGSSTFDYGHKLTAIKMGYEVGCDVLYWMDCDCHTEGWDDDAWDVLISDTNVDVWVNKQWLKTYKHTELPWYGGCVQSKFPNQPATATFKTFNEDRIIFTNMDVLSKMIQRWNVFKGNLNKWGIKATYGYDGMLMSAAAHDVGACCQKVTHNDFAKFERLTNRGNGDILNRQHVKRRS